MDEKQSSEEFSLRLTVLHRSARQHGVDPTLIEVNRLLLDIAEYESSLQGELRRLAHSCHIPDNWKNILTYLEEQGLDPNELSLINTERN